MTPDKPITILVMMLGSILCLFLPRRWAIVPLALSLCLYPSDLLLPPEGASMTAQRVIGLVLILRCLIAREIRSRFRWQLIDTVAVIYFLLLLASQLVESDLKQALVNRAGFLLSAMIPFWCVRFLIVDRESLFNLLKSWLWAAVPLAFLGLYHMRAGWNPYMVIQQYGFLKAKVAGAAHAVEKRIFLGVECFRASSPFMMSIMYGWFFAILMAPGLALYFEKKRVGIWLFTWLCLPLGVVASIAGGPMTMAAASLFLVALFPARRVGWALLWTTMTCVGAVYMLYMFGVFKRSPMEVLANMGMDSNSSWYRISLQDAVWGKGSMPSGMRGHWLAGYGAQPVFVGDHPLARCHDLCIHWVMLLVFHGLMGVVGFYGLITTCLWNLFKARKEARNSGDEFLLWTLMSMMFATLFGMLIVALFSEMYFIYHMFLGIVANSALLVGGRARQVGMMAEMNGFPVLVRYTLQPGQRLAIVQPAQTRKTGS